MLISVIPSAAEILDRLVAACRHTALLEGEADRRRIDTFRDHEHRQWVAPAPIVAKLRGELEQRDLEIARLRAQLAHRTDPAA
jgi:hypothetical protein